MARDLQIAVAACVLWQAVPVSAASPTSEWKIEPSEIRCVAVRQYLSDEKSITLAVKAPPTGNALQLAAIRNDFRRTSDQVGATVEIDGKPFTTYALGYPLGFPARSAKQSVSLIHLPPDAVAALRGAKHLGLKVRGSFQDGFVLGDSTKTWALMDACLERLRQTWSIGPSYSSNISKQANPLVPFDGMFSSDDFPRQAYKKAWRGTARFLLLIDETGKVRDCTLAESSGFAVIDSRSCAIVTYKARFEPALGQDGKPTKSVFEKSITWAVED